MCVENRQGLDGVMYEDIWLKMLMDDSDVVICDRISVQYAEGDMLSTREDVVIVKMML